MFVQLAEVCLRVMWRRFQQLNGEGGEVVESEINRPETENPAIKADIDLQGVVQEFLRRRAGVFTRRDIRVVLLPEHSESQYGPFEFGSGAKTVYMALDPLDNSDAYAEGIMTDIFGALSFLDEKGHPLGGGIIDYVQSRCYLRTESGELTTFSLEERKKKLLALPENLKQNFDGGIRIAGFTQKLKYLLAWDFVMLPILKRYRVWKRIETYGGSGLYARFPKIDAYVMPGGRFLDEATEEPRGEIDPALAVIDALHLTLLVVSPEGRVEPYRFSPEKFKERVEGAFIAACTEELAWAIVEELQSRSGWKQVVQKIERTKGIFNLGRLAMQST